MDGAENRVFSVLYAGNIVLAVKPLHNWLVPVRDVGGC